MYALLMGIALALSLVAILAAGIIGAMVTGSNLFGLLTALASCWGLWGYALPALDRHFDNRQANKGQFK